MTRIVEDAFAPNPMPEGFLASRIALWNHPFHTVTWAEQASASQDEMREMEPRYGSIDIPVLVVHGREDRLVPIDLGRRLAAGIPQARLTELPDTGHYVQFARPAELALAIQSIAGRR